MFDSSRRSSLAFLLPAILLVTGVADLGLRVIPPERIARRSWEAATLFTTGQGPFAPRKRFEAPAATGDLTTLANLPIGQPRHRESFTTGPQGFRTYDLSTDPVPRALVFGDSFGAGAALPDEATLEARLGHMLGGTVVFGGFYYDTLVKLRALPPAPLVILQLSERNVLPSSFAPEDLDTPSLTDRLLGRTSPARTALRYLRDVPSYSPLAIWAGRAYKALQNDAVLPNPYRRNVAHFRLQTGDTMLFLPSEVEHRLTPPPVHIDSVLTIRNHIQARGERVVVVLVPDKLSVYGPLLVDAPPRPPRLYIEEQEMRLAAAGVEVVNLLPALSRAARETLASGEYLYYLDDTHWNEAGVSVAATEILRRLRETDIAR